MGRKFKKHKILNKNIIHDFEIIKVKNRNKNLKQITHQFHITELDRITYSYKIDSNKEIREVTCVSYELLVDRDWKTLVYYDTVHGGVMHRHVNLYLKKNLEEINETGIKKSGTQKDLLSWAIRSIKLYYINYKKGFIKRNREYISNHNIDLY